MLNTCEIIKDIRAIRDDALHLGFHENPSFDAAIAKTCNDMLKSMNERGMFNSFYTETLNIESLPKYQDIKTPEDLSKLKQLIQSAQYPRYFTEDELPIRDDRELEGKEWEIYASLNHSDVQHMYDRFDYELPDETYLCADELATAEYSIDAREAIVTLFCKRDLQVEVLYLLEQGEHSPLQNNLEEMKPYIESVCQYYDGITEQEWMYKTAKAIRDSNPDHLFPEDLKTTYKIAPGSWFDDSHQDRFHIELSDRIMDGFFALTPEGKEIRSAAIAYEKGEDTSLRSFLASTLDLYNHSLDIAYKIDAVIQTELFPQQDIMNTLKTILPEYKMDSIQKCLDTMKDSSSYDYLKESPHKINMIKRDYQEKLAIKELKKGNIIPAANIFIKTYIEKVEVPHEIKEQVKANFMKGMRILEAGIRKMKETIHQR